MPVPKSLENLFSLNGQIWSLFLAKYHPWWKNFKYVSHNVSNLRKQCLCYLLFYKWWKPCFLISKRVFRWFLQNYTDFAHEISHMKPSKYYSTFGTKISICLKKVGGWGCGSEQAPLIQIYLKICLLTDHQDPSFHYFCLFFSHLFCGKLKRQMFVRNRSYFALKPKAILLICYLQEVAEPLADLKKGMEDLKECKTFRYILATLLAIGNFLNSAQVSLGLTFWQINSFKKSQQFTENNGAMMVRDDNSSWCYS